MTPNLDKIPFGTFTFGTMFGWPGKTCQRALEDGRLLMLLHKRPQKVRVFFTEPVQQLWQDLLAEVICFSHRNLEHFGFCLQNFDNDVETNFINSVGALYSNFSLIIGFLQPKSVKNSSWKNRLLQIICPLSRQSLKK